MKSISRRRRIKKRNGLSKHLSCLKCLFLTKLCLNALGVSLRFELLNFLIKKFSVSLRFVFSNSNCLIMSLHLNFIFESYDRKKFSISSFWLYFKSKFFFDDKSRGFILFEFSWIWILKQKNNLNHDANSLFWYFEIQLNMMKVLYCSRRNLIYHVLYTAFILTYGQFTYSTRSVWKGKVVIGKKRKI